MNRIFLLIASFCLAGQVAWAQDYEVKPISLNKNNSSEISPVVVDSTLYFISDRRNELFVAYIDQNNKLLYRWYQAPILPNDSIGDAKLFLPQVQGKGQNGPFTISKGGEKILATQMPLANKKGKAAPISIYSYDKNGNSWGSADLVINNLKNKAIGQPTLSPNGNLLAFVSSSLAGNGKSDIFLCKKNEGIWSDPENIGSVINTKGNEVFPFFESNNKLFFASDNHNSSGGLDIFYTVFQDGNWQIPEAMPKPINSAYDDFSITLIDNQSRGFFASNRQGNDNIYFIKSLWPVFENVSPQVDDVYCFTLEEAGLDQSDTLPIAYRWDFGDGTSAKGKVVDHCFPGAGNYHVTLSAVDTVLKVDLKIVAEYDLPLIKTEQVFITAPLSIKVGEKTPFDAKLTHITSFTPSVYYWDFGDGERVKGLSVTHTYKKKGTYTITCGVVSETDSSMKMCNSIDVTVDDL